MGGGVTAAGGLLRDAGAGLDLLAGIGRRDCGGWGEGTPCQDCSVPYGWLVAPQTGGLGGMVDGRARLVGSQFWDVAWGAVG